MTFLLDVNVLIALIDPDHAGHDAAYHWFQEKGTRSWATCPITENGVIRIVTHPKYPGTPVSTAAIKTRRTDGHPKRRQHEVCHVGFGMLQPIGACVGLLYLWNFAPPSTHKNRGHRRWNCSYRAY